LGDYVQQYPDTMVGQVTAPNPAALLLNCCPHLGLLGVAERPSEDSTVQRY